MEDTSKVYILYSTAGNLVGVFSIAEKARDCAAEFKLLEGWYMAEYRINSTCGIFVSGTI